MSSSPSALPLTDTASKPRSRNSSIQEPSGLTVNQLKQASRPSSPSDISRQTLPPHFTVFIRLPFRRHGFEDPPAVGWDSAKDRKLWKLISSGKREIDWEGLSHDFNVDLSFLLMQAAWLSEKHMERIRKQVGKISAGGQSESPSVVGGIRMERTGSRDSKMQSASTATTVHRASPSLPLTLDTLNTPGANAPQARLPISRTPSSATVTQSKITGSLSRQPQPLQRALRGSSGSGRRPTPVATSAANSPRDEFYEDAIEHEGPSDSDSEDEPSALARSQAFRRPPVKAKARSKLDTLGSDDGDGEDDQDDDEDSGGYLPFAATSKSSGGKADPAATLRSTAKGQSQNTTSASRASVEAAIEPKPNRPNRENSNTTTEESPASSASSAMQRKLSSDTASGNDQAQRPGPISPRHRAQLASMSPRLRRDGSEGSPSMGSSFSDLDDASVTQSALEDALMSNMRHGGGSTMGGMASRMSSLRDALGRRNA